MFCAAFQLADAGYDVWLGSYRGNEYSEGHVNLTVKDKKYWEHRFDSLCIANNYLKIGFSVSMN